MKENMRQYICIKMAYRNGCHDTSKTYIALGGRAGDPAYAATSTGMRMLVDTNFALPVEGDLYDLRKKLIEAIQREINKKPMSKLPGLSFQLIDFELKKTVRDGFTRDEILEALGAGGIKGIEKLLCREVMK